MNNETLLIEEKKEFLNGTMPTPEDFTGMETAITKGWDEVNEKEIDVETPTKKELTTLPGTDVKGNAVRYCLLSDKRIAVVKEGKGADVEKATMEADGDKTKYLTSMMASTITIDGKGLNTFQLSAFKMKDYMALQVAFSDINF